MSLVYAAWSRGRCLSATHNANSSDPRTHRPAALAANSDHQHALAVRNDLLAEGGRLGAEVGAPDDAELDLTVDDEGEADGELLVADEARSAIDGVDGPEPALGAASRRSSVDRGEDPGESAPIE